MNGFILIVPIILVRYVVLGMISKDALRRAAYFPPLHGAERFAFAVYEISNTMIFIYTFFLHINTEQPIYYIGLLLYALGLILYIISTVAYAKPSENGVNCRGVYSISRNPMYVSYFIYFAGCSVLTKSFLLFVLLLIFQFSSHWIIISEERWCIETFGAKYAAYMRTVRRYL